MSADDFAAYVRGYRARLERALAALDDAQLPRLADALAALRARAGRLYVLGNGGSAATASHLANDLCAGLGARGIDAVALVEPAALAAAANDHGWAEVFAHQLASRLRPGDAVLALSASGSSENLLRAVALARARGAATWALVGMDGGRLRDAVDIAVHAPSAAGDFGPPEDAHLVLDHLLAGWLAR